jgi:hypothetical protein
MELRPRVPLLKLVSDVLLPIFRGSCPSVTKGVPADLKFVELIGLQIP